MLNETTSLLKPIDSFEVVQSVLLAAAVKGDAVVLSQLKPLLPVFDEPYRTVASILSRHHQNGEYVDKNTLGSRLRSNRLTRKTADGSVVELTTDQVVNLLFATEFQPPQLEAYVSLVKERLIEMRQADLRSEAAELAKTHGGDPHRFLAEAKELAARSCRLGLGTEEAYPNELLELIPYAERFARPADWFDVLGARFWISLLQLNL